VHLDSIPHRSKAGFAFASFWREDDRTSSVVHAGETRVNLDPVWPDVVSFDSVEWAPVGDGGHRFLLRTKDGDTTGHIDAVESAPNNLQLLAVVSGARRLEFATPAGHARKLRAVVKRSSDDEFYLPVSEVLLGDALRQATVRVHEASRRHSSFEAAERVWNETMRALYEISELALEGIQAHNRVELSTV
jgi:hypothetical protein